MHRTDWDDLSPAVQAAIKARTGPILATSTASAGKNSAIASLLETSSGQVFVKGLREEDPRSISQHREAEVNSYVTDVSPRLLWHAEVDGWCLLGFQVASGRHADYSPGSPDIPAIVDIMRRLAHIRCPELPRIKRAEERWSDFIDPANLPLLRGDALLHTDYAPDNVLIDGPRAQLIDWAWPTLGAAFIDPCCLIVRLIVAGHTPAEAEDCVASAETWRSAPDDVVAIFAAGLAKMWNEIADLDPIPWKKRMAAAAVSWHTRRECVHTDNGAI